MVMFPGAAKLKQPTYGQIIQLGVLWVSRECNNQMKKVYIDSVVQPCFIRTFPSIYLIMSQKATKILKSPKPVNFLTHSLHIC